MTQHMKPPIVCIIVKIFMIVIWAIVIRKINCFKPGFYAMDIGVQILSMTFHISRLLKYFHNRTHNKQAGFLINSSAKIGAIRYYETW